MNDVLIIGSGAGGGPLAWRLSRAGARVLVLERGPRLERADFPRGEVENYLPGFWYPKVSDDPHIVVRSDDPKPHPSSMGWIAVCVGGGTVHMGGYLYRFHPDDFRLRSRFGPYAAIADWPYSYDELEPYYVEAEWQVGVSGSPEPAHLGFRRSRDFPMPPLSAHPLTELFDRTCGELGLHPIPTPRSINSQWYQGRPPCSYCNLCAGAGCHTGAKGSSQETFIAGAEATGRCEVVPNATVFEVTVGADGRATGCRYFDADGQERQARAKIVCVSCSAVESARLLLMSKSPLFPDGLANGNGQVGRNLQFHAVTTASARFDLAGRDPDLWQHPHPFFGRSLLDYYFLPPDASSLPKGGVLRFSVPQAQPVALAQRIAEASGFTRWGAPLKAALRQFFVDSMSIEFEVFQDYIPNAGTYMVLDPQVTDPRGLPVARMYRESDPHHYTAGLWLQSRGLDILKAMGAQELRRGALGEPATFLVHGTCRAGHDPTTSVLNSYCRAHEVDNLFVVDGSFMPTCGGAAPTLTIIANSLRTADHIIAQARQGEWAN